MAHYKFDFVDLISATLQATDKRKCDENNNDKKADDEKKSPAADDERKSPKVDEEVFVPEEKLEKIKPKQMVGLFPLDLRSELKNRVGGKAGFSLKKSTTNVDVFKVKSDPIPIRLPDRSPTDLLKTLQEKDIKKKIDNKNDERDDEGGQENLSFKEKLLLIERSSSRSLVNPL